MENQTVNDYAKKERNKWNLQMAKNNCNSNQIPEKIKKDILELYRLYQEIDEELKDELPK